MGPAFSPNYPWSFLCLLWLHDECNQFPTVILHVWSYCLCFLCCLQILMSVLTILNSTLLKLNSIILKTTILNLTILNRVNKSAPTQLVRTTVPVAVTTTLLMTYTTAWVCSIRPHTSLSQVIQLYYLQC